MEIKYLKLIKTIAEEGNISNSAGKLFLTQSALSHQLKDIEDRLGIKIFMRSRNKWELTEEGHELYKLAIKVLNDIEIGINKINGIREGSKGKLRLKTECYSFYRGMPAFIQKMGILYPDIDIELMVESLGDPFTKLISNELDVAIVTCRPSDDQLTCVDLFEDEIYAIMHEEHQLADKEYLEPDDFRCLDLIIHSYPIETVTIYRHYLQKHNITPAKIMAIPLTEVAIDLVEANMGVTCIPKWTLRSIQIPDSLVFKKIGKQGLRRKHFVVYREEDQGKDYFEEFFENLLEEFSGFRTELSIR